MQTCVAALRLPVRMSVERVSGCSWAECPNGVESAAMRLGSRMLFQWKYKMSPLPHEPQR